MPVSVPPAEPRVTVTSSCPPFFATPPALLLSSQSPLSSINPNLNAEAELEAGQRESLQLSGIVNRQLLRLTGSGSSSTLRSGHVPPASDESNTEYEHKNARLRSQTTACAVLLTFVMTAS